MEIRVFKFGGASINSAGGVRNILSILRKYPFDPVLAVISAMGKITNALEQLLSYYISLDTVSMVDTFFKIRGYHLNIINDLFPSKEHPVYDHLENLFDQLQGHLKRGHLTPGLKLDYDFEYDQVVCYGELFSTAIVHHFLVLSGIHSTLFDARDLVKTDSRYRDARVDWKLTQTNIRENIENYFHSGNKEGRIAITQGFIGSDGENNSTTLGREGSDYSAAIFAYSLKAREVTIWKDVPGILNADPKWFEKPKKLTRLSYEEAIELTYFGASVIHPKTIKPLENANIILHVKSFLKPDTAGTTVKKIKKWKVRTPIFSRKQNQVLLSISPKNFSFIMEENLSQIFRILEKYKVKVNVMQNSAISFSLCVDGDQLMGSRCIKALQKNYSVRYNDSLELYTIRHYTLPAITQIVNDREVLLEQKTRNTVHLVLKSRG